MDLGIMYATIAVTDIDRAKEFYGGTLGLSVKDDQPFGVIYESGGTKLLVYPSQFGGTNQATSMTFEVKDIVATVKELASRGVAFERYDVPGLQTDADGIADLDGERSAWFKDPDGNILSVGQPT